MSFLLGADGTPIINNTPYSIQEISEALPAGVDSRITAAFQSWANDSKPPSQASRLGGIWDRNKFLSPVSVFEQIQIAREAGNDDVVGGGADLSESLALQSMHVKVSKNRDEQDSLNQWAGDVDLDNVMRQAWQSLYYDSQVVVGTWWGRKQYQVRGETESGLPRRKTYDLVVPTAFTIIDSLKVVPVGSNMFGREHLAYYADPSEHSEFQRIKGGDTGQGMAWFGGTDQATPTYMRDEDIIERLIRYEYKPDGIEKDRLQRLGLPTERLWLMDNRFVWRHTLTKPTSDLFSRVRLRSVFEYLDAKNQLKQQDRAMLIAGTNFIIVITVGSDTHPPTGREVDGLQAQAANLGKVPLLVGDHRLNVEIVSPPQDSVLSASRYDTLDNRIAARVFGSFVPTGDSNEDPLKMGRLIATGLESRRHMLKRAFEANVLKVIVDSNASLTGSAKLRFDPARIGLSFDQSWASFLLDLREAKEISRETTLSQFGMDQSDEAEYREMEAELFDDTFGTIVPHGANPENGGESARLATRSGGRQGGGRNNGGGLAPGSGQGEQEARRARRSNVVAELKGMSRPELIEVAGSLDDPIPLRHRKKANDLRDEIVAYMFPEDNDND